MLEEKKKIDMSDWLIMYRKKKKKKKCELMILINLNGCLMFDETMIILKKTRKCTKQMRREKKEKEYQCYACKFLFTVQMSSKDQTSAIDRLRDY
jgi:hypothetical protein